MIGLEDPVLDRRIEHRYTVHAAAAIESIKRTLTGGPVYVTYDVDGLDPTEAPAPRAGRISMRDLQVMLRALTGRPIVGGDVCEVAPSLDPAGLTARSTRPTFLF